MTKSTSIHNLNADKGLGFIEKFLYLLLNWVNNLFPYTNLDRRISIRTYGSEMWKAEWSKTYPDSSAARKLSDLFWRTLPWQEMKKELAEIHIFDTGCGQGNYSTRIQGASEGLISSYVGIDAKRRPNWNTLETENLNFKFIESSSNDIKPLIPGDTNLFVTQSAIEHFDNDLLFFEQIREFVDKKASPVIQIHIFPAAATLPLYLFHGLRQYTPRTISKITRLFGDDSKFYLYGLGGNKGKRIQWKYFTWPVLILRKYAKATFDTETYDKELKRAVERDVLNPSKSPLFWALIIYSHPRRKIW